MRSYYFSADTQEDMLGWVRALGQAAAMEQEGTLNRCGTSNHLARLNPNPNVPLMKTHSKHTHIPETYSKHTHTPQTYSKHTIANIQHSKHTANTHTPNK